MLRPRRRGAEASADVHVQVAPRLSVSEGHMISQAVEDRMIEQVDSITDVTVHIDPEDDEDAPTCAGLPLRAEALEALDDAWTEAGAPLAPHETRLHYLSGKIDVELILPLSHFVDRRATDQLRAHLEAVARGLPWFGGLRLLYE